MCRGNAPREAYLGAGSLATWFLSRRTTGKVSDSARCKGITCYHSLRQIRDVRRLSIASMGNHVDAVHGGIAQLNVHRTYSQDARNNLDAENAERKSTGLKRSMLRGAKTVPSYQDITTNGVQVTLRLR